MRNEALELIRETCGAEEPELSEESPFCELSIDSLSFVELIVRVEEAFGIEFEDEELSVYAWRLTGDFIDAAEKNYRAAHAAKKTSKRGKGKKE